MHTVTRFVCAAALAAAGMAATSPALEAQSFADPTGWAVGQSHSTHQTWDVFTQPTGNEPDISYQTSPGISESPTVDVLSPGFASLNSGNLYSFSGNYSVEVYIPNHGDPHGQGTSAGLGTHVIVQFYSGLNEDTGTIVDSLRLLGTEGQNLLGGDNASALNNRRLHDATIYNSQSNSHDPAEYYIWEFFLPEFTDDFVIATDVVVHSSTAAIRVDTMLSEGAFAIIPEPASAGLLVCGVMVLMGRRGGRR